MIICRELSWFDFVAMRKNINNQHKTEGFAFKKNF